MCSRPTTTVLATSNTVDFIYTCDAHLSDPGFASSVGEAGDAAGGARKLGLSSDEIAKIKEEWDEQQRRKADRLKEKQKANDKDKEGDGKDSEKAKAADTKVPGALTSSSPSPGPSPTPTASHQRYSLHRDFFAMRLAVHRKRRQTAQAKEIAPRLPSAPRQPMPGDLPSGI